MINALALSRVWYVASLVHVPPWVSSDLCKLAFDISWKGKRDVVPSSLIVEPTFAGSFNVFDVKLKVWSLIVQWSSVFLFPTGFGLFLVLLLFVFCQVLFVLILGRYLRFFFCFLLLALRAMDGAFSSSRSCLVIGFSSPYHLYVPFGMSTKFCYVYLLSEHQSIPHCVDKFLPSYGVLYWSTTWQQPFFSFFFFYLD